MFRRYEMWESNDWLEDFIESPGWKINGLHEEKTHKRVFLRTRSERKNCCWISNRGILMLENSTAKT